MDLQSRKFFILTRGTNTIINISVNGITCWRDTSIIIFGTILLCFTEFHFSVSQDTRYSEIKLNRLD